MGLTAWLVILGVLVFSSASFFFALAETSLFALGKWRARQISGTVGGARLVQLLEQPSELLATIVLGNTVANGAVVTLALWPALSGMWPVWWSLLLAVALILIGCEVVPKTLAVRAPETWALRVARPMLVVQDLTGWLERLFRRFNEVLLGMLTRGVSRPLLASPDDEYKELVELAFQQGTLAQSEKEIILQIISLDRKTAKDVMKPRSQMAAISDELSVEEMVEAARRLKHRRLPIYDETPDTIVGVLDTQALLLDPGMDLADAIEFPSFVPESMNLLQLLQSLQRQKRGLAMVLDEFGGTAGLVTVEDILEEVVGRLAAEGEQSGFVMEKLETGRWRVSGAMRLEDFQREYPGLGELPGLDTMSGLFVSQLEEVPSAGESTIFRGLKLTARVVDDRRVKELLVEAVKRK